MTIRFVACAVILAVLSGPVSLCAQGLTEEEIAQWRGRRFAEDQHNENLWFGLGGCLGIFVMPVALGYSREPDPKPLIGKTDSYCRAYVAGYQQRKKELQMRDTVQGFTVILGIAVGVWWFFGS